MSYAAAHGPLLLRSGKTDNYATRLDVLILDVRAMELRSWFEGIEIRQVDHGYLLGFPSNPIDLIEPSLNVYALLGRGWQGFVLGGRLFVHEDEAELMAPSALLPD